MVTHVFTVLFYVKMAAVKKVYNVHVNCIDESWEKLYSVFVYTARLIYLSTFKTVRLSECLVACTVI